MVKVMMYGCNGYMGHVICNLIKDMENVTVAAGIDPCPGDQKDFPVFTSLDACDVDVDVIIDFSAAVAVDGVLEEASKQTAVLRSANMSLGVNTLLEMVKTAAKILGEAGFDIDIVEKHHRRKLDAPSGTALAFADSINEAADGKYNYVFDRSERRMPRPADEIGISAVRGGTIVGEHEIIFAGTDEVIEFKHTAYSRAVFGKGAVEAAVYLADKPAGLYDMQDVIAAK